MVSALVRQTEITNYETLEKVFLCRHGTSTTERFDPPPFQQFWISWSHDFRHTLDFRPCSVISIPRAYSASLGHKNGCICPDTIPTLPNGTLPEMERKISVCFRPRRQPRRVRLSLRFGANQTTKTPKNLEIILCDVLEPWTAPCTCHTAI